MGKIITSFAATGRECYPKAQLRLIKSVANCFVKNSHIWQFHRCFDGYCDEYANERIHLGSWPITKKYGTAWQHADAPYQFKPFIIQECVERGHNQVIWCDSTIILADDPKPIFDYAKQHGVCAVDNQDFPLADWISDEAVKTTGIQSLEGVKQIMGCMVAFDLDNPKGKEIFDKWIELSRDGKSFQDNGSDRPGFRAHRHDQAVLSALLHVYGVPVLPYGVLCYAELAHKHPERIFVNTGL